MYINILKILQNKPTNYKIDYDSTFMCIRLIILYYNIRN